MIADVFLNCTSANAYRFVFSPSGLFTCMQPEPCSNVIGQYYSDYNQRPECFQCQTLVSPCLQILYACADFCLYRLIFVSLTPGETSDGTGPGCPWCPCGPAGPGRAGVWSSSLSGVRTPSLLPQSIDGLHSWSVAAVPAPCTAMHPSQRTCPGRWRWRRKTATEGISGVFLMTMSNLAEELHNKLIDTYL